MSEPKGPNLLPILQKDSDHPCFQCARCCTYVAIEIDAPTTMREYDYVVWYLYHAGISVFVDFENAWYVKFETRCQNLTDAGLCAIYERRPAICKDFDWRECENHLKDEPADRWLFETSDAFLAWLAERRPKAYQRYQRFLRRKHADGEEPELGRISAPRRPPGKGSRRASPAKRERRRRG